MNILIVDDDVVDRKIIKRTIAKKNINAKVTEVSSVQEGLEKLAKHDFDIILLDFRMPKVDGIEMVIELRSRTDLGRTAIIMMSSSESEQLAINCIEAGAQDFIAKSELTESKLQRAIIHAQKRFTLEKKLHDSYMTAKRMAEKDQLTGLSNRYHFEENLRVMLANTRRTNEKVALLMLDLDNFKYVNDSFGHDAGDQLLIQIVQRIGRCLRKDEGFARLGGDEFAILICGINSMGEISNIAQRILAVFEATFNLNGHEVSSGVSIGVALYPINTYKSEELMKFADIAMYRAKQSGKNTVCFYEQKMQEEFSQRYAIQTAIKKAIQQSSFELHFQPVFAIKDNQLTSFEALIRWPTHSETKYTPDVFIPIAEETHQIYDIGNWVIENAIQHLAHWQKKTSQDISVSINISPVQLQQDNTTNFIKTNITKHNIKPANVILEITETALFKESDKIKSSLEILSKFGCRIALDDFGTGYSSISHLITYPIDIVKIDKSLFSQNNEDIKRVKIFKGLALMLKTLDFSIIAEGVETQEQLTLCKELSIHKVQGYLLGKPTSTSEIEDKYIDD
ncbi:two-component system response regulator [Flocculibacter collagenilyticus]|uniref:two-component system response regulator n=1 Tax=Flocculibacter collagenilyticus TaxID=2744479 RepID=UPI0018F7A847|nr:GGDEF domain-containing response regulator [Flocculibacter collagenilyticus]